MRTTGGRSGQERPRIPTRPWTLLQGPEVELLEQVPADRKVAIGIVNHRVLQVETAEQIADRIRRALTHIAPERLYLTTFCGLGSTLPRTIALYKLCALVEGARLVRAELLGQQPGPH